MRDLREVIEDYGLKKLTDAEVSSEELTAVCNKIIDEQQKTVKSIKKGKVNGLNFLVGQAMRATQGTIDANVFETEFKQLLDVE